MHRALWAALLFVAACGSSAKPNDRTGGGGGGGAGTSGGGGGGGGGTVGVDSGVCANVACLQTAWDLTLACSGDGTCSEQTTAMPLTQARCYDNGVHVLMTSETSTGATTSTVTLTFEVNKNGALCFSRTAIDVFPADTEAGTAAQSTDLKTTDPSGALVATVHVENGVTTVTCPGGPPTVLSASCGFSGIMVTGSYVVASTASTCTAGTCTF